MWDGSKMYFRLSEPSWWLFWVGIVWAMTISSCRTIRSTIYSWRSHILASNCFDYDEARNYWKSSRKFFFILEMADDLTKVNRFRNHLAVGRRFRFQSAFDCRGNDETRLWCWRWRTFYLIVSLTMEMAVEASRCVASFKEQAGLWSIYVKANLSSVGETLANLC